MTSRQAYDKGWEDYLNGVRYDEPPELVLGSEVLLDAWHLGWMDGLRSD